MASKDKCLSSKRVVAMRLAEPAPFSTSYYAELGRTDAGAERAEALDQAALLKRVGGWLIWSEDGGPVTDIVEPHEDVDVLYPNAIKIGGFE
jgi:hypothetical protein